MLYKFKLSKTAEWAYIEGECPSQVLEKIGCKVWQIEKADPGRLPLEMPFALWETGFAGGRLSLAAYFANLDQAREYVDLQAVRGKDFAVVDRGTMETIYPTADDL